MLFTVYGVNIESITVVVSAFMLGLGLGSLGGGRLTRQSKVSPLVLFCVLEFAIAAFGLASPSVFRWVGEVTLGASLFATALLSFSLVVVPTVLMGASLPLLVAHLLRNSKNMGRAVGLLYFVNTLGSASACFLAIWITFPRFGLSGTILIAALLNGLVAAGALLVHLRSQRSSEADGERVPRDKTASSTHTHSRSFPEEPLRDADALLSFPLVMLLAAVSGFISLSYEVILARAYSFVAEGRASAFPLLLGWYLVGIAVGSLVSGIYCARSTSTKSAQLRTIGYYFLFVNLFGYLTIPLMSDFATYISFERTYPLAALLSGGLGAILPLVALSLFFPGTRPQQKVLVSALTLLFVLAMIGGKERAFHHVYERLLWKEKYDERTPSFRHIVENRSGVVTVTRGGMVFGGGVYDGQLSTDLVHDRNSIVRPYIVSAFHSRPSRVLVIGLSTGAWAQVLLAHPHVESLTAVEINPGYLDIIPRSEAVRTLLLNPKLKVVIDDGRRWLAHHPDEKFDVIVMNTTFHWHAYAANLLSREFLTDIKAHLYPGGLALYNTTSSPEAQRTGALVFPHALRFLNNMYVSTSPLVANRQRLKEVLMSYEIDGKKVFDLQDALHMSRLNHTLALFDHFTTPPELEGFETRGDILARTERARIITDDNMGTEWTFNFAHR